MIPLNIKTLLKDLTFLESLYLGVEETNKKFKLNLTIDEANYLLKITVTQWGKL